MAPERRIFHPESPITIALDIDDTLGSMVLKDDLDNDYISWFRENDLIVDAIEKHIIHPGVIEFIRYLYENPNIKFCFFSHGVAERNHPFVSQLLKRALCDKKYKHALSEEEFKLFEEKMKDNIFSRGDCSSSIGGGYYKDLRKVTLKLGGDLRSTILMDDQRSNLSNDQKQNGLIIPYSNHLVFRNIFIKPFGFLGEAEWREPQMRAANHIFCATALLDMVLSIHSKPITQSLFELQYQEDGNSRFELYENNSLYINGLKKLQQFATSTLKFYGHDANEFFGFKKNGHALTNILSHSPFWSVSSIPTEHKKVNESDDSIVKRFCLTL